MDNNKNNFKVLDATKTFPNQKNEMRAALKAMGDIFPELIELGKMKSEYNKKRYDGLIEQGFTETQALEIVKSEKTPFDATN